jgi:hypothetical protein
MPEADAFPWDQDPLVHCGNLGVDRTAQGDRSGFDDTSYAGGVRSGHEKEELGLRRKSAHLFQEVVLDPPTDAQHLTLPKSIAGWALRQVPT